jgi:hypothetical protein
MFVVNNRNLFFNYADLYSIKQGTAITFITKYQKGVHYAGIWPFSLLPTSIKNTANETKVFKKTLKRFLMDNSFYSIDEFLNFKE